MSDSNIVIACLAALLAFGASSPMALARPARCEIRSSVAVYAGKCDFLAEKGNGGFSITPAGAKYFPDGVSVISVYKNGSSKAEVRGLTRDGVNSRWGPSTRSTRDPACWEGVDFSICVY